MGTKLEDRVALVTGGTKGIGTAIARALLGEGASVVICGRSAESVDQAVADLGPLGCVEGRVCDVGRFADVSELFRFANETFGKLDYLINNAGVGRFAPLGDLDPAAWD